MIAPSPTLSGLLDAARQAPEDDTPRLILADWLEDRGGHGQAEFVRLQCRLARLTETSARLEIQKRCAWLQNREGGAWLGPLWRWADSTSWHRGLLSVRIPDALVEADLDDVMPWIDTITFRITGQRSLLRAASLVALSGINHAHLRFSHRLRLATMLDALAAVPESPCLRTLSIASPLGLLALTSDSPDARQCAPTVDADFLRQLLGCRACRHLTHLGSSWPFAHDQQNLIRGHGVEPAHARDRGWMHEVAPASFRRECPRPG